MFYLIQSNCCKLSTRNCIIWNESSLSCHF